MSQAANVVQYEARAKSTDTFGRAVCSVRDHHHFVVDGPLHNQCPGEAVTPGEVFLASIVSCGVGLMQVIAKEEGVSLAAARVTISGTVDRSKQVRPDLTLFNEVRLDFYLKGVTEAQGVQLVEKFKGRCPLYGTVAAAIANVHVKAHIER